jgi:hypothetical protein
MSLICILSLGFIIFSCSHKNKDEVMQKQTSEETQLEGVHYSALEFRPGLSTLSSNNKRRLNALAQRASREGREIEYIQILTWADRDHSPLTRTNPREVILATERAQNIKYYLQNDLHANDPINLFNMVKDPEQMSKIFKNDEWAVREAFEKSGHSPVRVRDGSITYTKASKALVIINYAE